VVSRTVQDDGSYRGGTTYLTIEKTYGLREWQQHAAHASKMRWLDAVMLAWLLPALPPQPGENEDKNVEYFYHFQEQP
jgi:hypothetical protein